MGAGAGAGGFDPQAFQNMLQSMMGGAGAGGGMMPPMFGFGGGRCGGRGRWGGRRGMKGQRGPYNAEIVYSETARKNRRHPKEVTLDDPSVSFTLKNTGEAAWPEGSRVLYMRHARIAPLEIDLPVAQPGETVTIKLPLNVSELGAPDSDVVHHAVYRLKLPPTLPPPRKFGDVLHVRVKLVSAKKEAEEEIPAKTGAPSAPVEKAAPKEAAAPRRKVSALSPPVYAEDEANDESKDYEPPRGSETAEPAAAEKPAVKQEEDKKPAVPAEKTTTEDPKPAGAPATLPADLEDGYAEKLKFLEEMGFTTSADLNLWVLREAKGNVQEAALKLVQLHAA